MLLNPLGCAVGVEPAAIAEATVRSSFGNSNAAAIIGHPTPATIECAILVNGVLVRDID